MTDLRFQDLLSALEYDFLRASQGLIALPSPGDGGIGPTSHPEHFYQLRLVVRTAFAYFEGVTFYLKLVSAKACIDKGLEVTQAERYLVGEVEHRVTDSGEVVQRPAHIRLSANVRFAFNLAEKAFDMKGAFDPSADWWACFQAAVKIRDRLTHPRWASDLEIGPDEMMQVINAKAGFTALATAYAARAA